jgi:hypothetical protein
MSNQKKILFIGAALFIVLLITLMYLSRLASPSPVPGVATTPTQVPTEETPLPTNDPLITSTVIFETPPTIIPKDTFDKALHEALKQEELTNRPDITISNQTPYSTDRFIVTTDFVDEQGGYYAITVSKVVEDDVKKEAEDWFKSLGLTDKAIAKLKITYK